MRSHAPRSYQRALVAIGAVAFMCRLAIRTFMGASDFWVHGYSVYFDMAKAIASGQGVSLGGVPTAFRVPGYPLFLAAVSRGHASFFAIITAQATVGAATAVVAGLLARDLFSPACGVIAAILTAVYPYYAVHDTAMQETGLQTCLTLASVCLLLAGGRNGSLKMAAASAFVLGLAILTRATLAPFAPLAALWLAVFGAGRARSRATQALAFAIVLAATLSPWLVESYRIAGAPTLSTEAGMRLWAGNNAYTFTHYPTGSIDASTDEAWQALDPGVRDRLVRGGPDALASDRWFRQQALRFIVGHPWTTVAAAGRKLTAAFWILPSPRKGLIANAVYALSYGPIMLLGLAGMARARHAWREHAPIYLLFATFALVTAVFFGHTSHRSFLDVYWIVFASSILVRV